MRSAHDFPPPRAGEVANRTCGEPEGAANILPPAHNLCYLSCVACSGPGMGNFFAKRKRCHISRVAAAYGAGAILT